MRKHNSALTNGDTVDYRENLLEVIKLLSGALVLQGMIFYRYASLRENGRLVARGNWNQARLIMPFSDSYSAVAIIERHKGQLSCLVTIDNVDRTEWMAKGFKNPDIDALVFAAEFHLPRNQWDIEHLASNSQGVLYSGDPKLIAVKLLMATAGSSALN
ncbi:hypothetical protein EET67_24525 [Pseudaminobacter arsenicus]|uniref:Uncharacterized protein n=1 Tax=Borborobacter arsenicus TaxID=1851146 RepID=A0A432UZ81_9HYPH|nr:hypothetical protein [Pseudaminobacter arsenicus]RUM95219.1 hypothetical protein EET67_24525 [Pseudaminobacter arsenicus]